MTPEEINTYVNESAIWCALGFVGGVTVASVVRRDGPEHVLLRTILGLVILGMATWLVWSQAQTNQCARDSVAAYKVGYDERLQAAAIEREATQIRWRFIQEVLAKPLTEQPSLADQNRDRARWLADLQEADRLVAEAEEKRRNAPPPDAVLQDCS